MIQTVLDAVLSALRDAGLHAVAQYPAAPFDKTAPTVCVGVRSEVLETPGFGQYLGKEVRKGVPVELYGVKARLTVLLDLYLPGTMADACQTLFSQVAGALSNLPAGLRMKGLVRGELAPDRATGMLRCPLELECAAYCAGVVEEDGGVWLDFKLRGVLNNERE